MRPFVAMREQEFEQPTRVQGIANEGIAEGLIRYVLLIEVGCYPATDQFPPLFLCAKGRYIKGIIKLREESEDGHKI
jgi:hypothetical protein